MDRIALTTGPTPLMTSLLRHCRYVLLFIPLCTGAADTPDWSYDRDTGPQHWGEISDQYALCTEGRRQSPIAIRQLRSRRLPVLSTHYRSSPLQIENDGRTVRVHYPTGSYLRVGSHRYELVEFHFHTPGEHIMNGVKGDMEIHLVHRDSDGKIGVIAVSVVTGRRFNAMLQRLWEHIPRTPGERRYHRRVGIKPVFLMPASRRYVMYRGSLETPPCSEGVTWFVLLTPLEISARQLADFQQVLGDNARPVQALHGRPVWADP